MTGEAPRYVAPRSEKDNQPQDPRLYQLPEGKNHGVFVGVRTAQQGVEIEAEYDQLFNHAALAAGTEYEGFRFDVKTVLDVPSIGEMSTEKTTSVSAVIRRHGRPGHCCQLRRRMGTCCQTADPHHRCKHTLGLIPAIDGLEDRGEVSASELALESIGYKIGAEFEAPNGVNLGIEHDRFEGTTFAAGMKVEF